LTGSGQDQRRLSPLEQWDLVALLKRAELLRYRGLRHGQAAGGAHDAALAGDRVKGPEMLKIGRHRSPPGGFSSPVG
jgi:hypothetical protein